MKCATRVWHWSILTGLAATVIFAGGCDTPYTNRVKYLDDLYQRGDLPREDYIRFVREAERWESK